jgi:hypothetical protein
MFHPPGLCPIADPLAVQLVPAVRERIQRLRLLTVMAIGALVTKGLEDPEHRYASPGLVWQFPVVGPLVRKMGGTSSLWGPGPSATRRAIDLRWP